MARTRNNCVTTHTSGKLGHTVFTIDGTMRSRPDVNKRVWSPLQKEHLTRIEEAKEYARMAISDPALNEFYAERAARKHGLGAWHLAIRDYYYPPVIHSVNFHDFKGRRRDTVRIYALDNFKVAAAKMKFTSPEGIIPDEGNGFEEELHGDWIYILKSDIELAAGLRVAIQVWDLPGNQTTEELMWPFKCDTEIFFEKESPPSSKKRTKSQLRIRKEGLYQDHNKVDTGLQISGKSEKG